MLTCVNLSQACWNTAPNSPSCGRVTRVAARHMQRKTFLTAVGPITLDCEVLATPDGQQLDGESAPVAVVGYQAVG